MTFYVKPPDGRVLLRVLENGAYSRLMLLMNIHSPKPFETEGLIIDHVMENTVLDRISHFMLRLACLFSQEFKSFFIRAETTFFKERLSSYDWTDVHKMIQMLHRHLQEKRMHFDSCGSGIRTYSAISLTCSELLKGKNLKHAFHKSHGGACREHTVIVDFQYCSSLVRRREVELKSGKCHVHCGVWGKLLICFFCDLLVLGVDDLARSTIREIVSGDIRLKSIVSQTQEIFFGQLYSSCKNLRETNTIKAITVDMESEFFPPCALNILKTLRHDHRVGHHARIQFSLFLKGIGLDVSEAIAFWKEEYSKTPNCNEHGISSCQHAWKKDNSRYIYNINHLYGLKGSCKNYQSKSCLALQSTGGKTGEGCPFVRMNPKDIVKVLPQVIVNSHGNHKSSIGSLIEQVVEHTSKGNPSDACKACFDAHYVALQVGNLSKLSVSEDVHSKRENTGTSVDEVKMTTKFITGKDLNDEATSSGRFVKGLASGSDRSSLGNISPELANDIGFNYPTEYYFSLKTKLSSKNKSTNYD